MSVEAEIIENTNLPAVRPERSSVVLAPVMDVNTAMKRLEEFQRFISGYLKEGIDEDYGVIPGTKKKTLLKPGADKLAEVYGLADEYEIMSKVENWDTGLFDYAVKCILRSRRDDSLVGTGLGSCSSWESKYRWRDSQRKCPHCQQPAIIKGKDFKGDGQPTGWLCFAKKGGCGAKFRDGDKAIEGQVIGRVQNDDIIDAKNTVLKMAKKRAKIDAIIGVTRSSGIFTQDFGEDEAPVRAKEPEVIGESVTYSKSAAANSGNGVASESKGSDVQSQAAETLSDCIDEGQAANFYKMFRDSLKPAHRKHADELAHEWLRSQDIKDVLGKPSALAIRKASFYDVREAAVAYAKTL